MKALSARIKKLETRRKSPERVLSNVVCIDVETDRVLSPLPTSDKIMLYYSYGSDADWEAAALQQQATLIEQACAPCQ